MRIKREIQAEHDAAFMGPIDGQDGDVSTVKEKKKRAGGRLLGEDD